MKALGRIGLLALVTLFLAINLCYGQNTIEQSSARGVKYAAQGKFKEAKEEFEKVLKIDPLFNPAKRCLKFIEEVNEGKIKADAAISYFKGSAYARKGQWDEAISEINKAISDFSKAREINPMYDAAYIVRGNAYLGKGHDEEAISNYSKALEINPKYAMAYKNRGYAYSINGQLDQAISDYTKAIEIDPKYVDTYNDRGCAYFDKGQHDQAISDYTKAIEIDPKYAMAYSNRAYAFFFKREYDKAWDDVHKIQNLGYQVHPDFLKALHEASGREK
jgi:tetratricopeptide (TPR) repeat protein